MDIQVRCEPFVLISGILIPIMPRLLNCIVALCLIAIGLLGLAG